MTVKIIAAGIITNDTHRNIYSYTVQEAATVFTVMRIILLAKRKAYLVLRFKVQVLLNDGCAWKIVCDGCYATWLR